MPGSVSTSFLYGSLFPSQVKNWVKELKKMLGSEICLIIAGNKLDLEKQRNVSVQDAEE